jgi:hypothetical protein
MVIEDPSDKRNIKGFLRLRYAYSESMQKRHQSNFEGRMIRGLITVMEAMNQYTDIKATIEGRIPFTSREMTKTPWVFCSYGREPFLFPDQEAACLGDYLMDGGFLLFDALPLLPHHQKGPPIIQ